MDGNGHLYAGVTDGRWWEITAGQPRIVTGQTGMIGDLTVGRDGAVYTAEIGGSVSRPDGVGSNQRGLHPGVVPGHGPSRPEHGNGGHGQADRQQEHRRVQARPDTLAAGKASINNTSRRGELHWPARRTRAGQENYAVTALTNRSWA
jgi:hypothetical protein